MDALCNITYLVKVLCYSVKFIDYVCMLLDFISDAIIGTVEKSNLFTYYLFINRPLKASLCDCQLK